MNEFAFLTIQALQQALAAKEITPQELVRFFLRRFHAFDPQIQSALELFDETSVLAQMQQGPLAGIVGLIKANILMKGRQPTCASRILQGYHAPYTATAVERINARGGVALGYANMDEFAMGSSTETSAYFKTKNPWDISRVPGGSSGGSAAAVAAGFVPWALGTDTGGSVRQPAALCGVVGLKPTYGLVSRYGVIAYGSSLDQIGVFTRSVWDNACILSCIAGNDLRDASTLPALPTDYTAQLKPDLPSKLRIGVVTNAVDVHGIDPEVHHAIEEAIDVFVQLGATIIPVQMPSFDYSAAAYFIISRAEAASNLGRFDGVRYGFRASGAHSLRDMYQKTRHDGFGPEVRSRIIIGNYVLSASHASDYYDNAQKVRDMLRHEFTNAFQNVDVLLLPTSPSAAFHFGAFDMNKLQLDLQDYFTCPMNLAGNPALSVPCGFTSQQLPIGMQLVGPQVSEALLYRVAYAYEHATPWHTMHPQVENL